MKGSIENINQSSVCSIFAAVKYVRRARESLQSVRSLISTRTFSESGKSYEVCGTVIVNHGSFSAQMK